MEQKKFDDACRILDRKREIENLIRDQNEIKENCDKGYLQYAVDKLLQVGKWTYEGSIESEFAKRIQSAMCDYLGELVNQEMQDANLALKQVQDEFEAL